MVDEATLDLVRSLNRWIEQGLTSGQQNPDHVVATLAALFEGWAPELPQGDQSILVLGLDVQTYRMIRQEGIRTLGDLAATSAHELRSQITPIGPKRLRKIRSALAAHGLKLKDE